MVTTIDSAGRVVIPKPMRARLGLHGGSEIEVILVGGHVEVHPRGVDVLVEQLSDGPLLRATGEVPRLTVEDVRRLVEEDREA